MRAMSEPSNTLAERIEYIYLTYGRPLEQAEQELHIVQRNLNRWPMRFTRGDLRRARKAHWLAKRRWKQFSQRFWKK